MERELADLHWFKSSAGAAGNCVEVAHLPGGGVAVRDSRTVSRRRTSIPALSGRRSWWRQDGEFDPPLA